MKELLIKLCQNITGSISAVSGMSSCYWCNGNCTAGSQPKRL